MNAVMTRIGGARRGWLHRTIGPRRCADRGETIGHALRRPNIARSALLLVALLMSHPTRGQPQPTPAQTPPGPVWRGVVFNRSVRSQLPRCTTRRITQTRTCWEPSTFCTGTACQQPETITFVDGVNALLSANRAQVIEDHGVLAQLLLDVLTIEFPVMDDLFTAQYGSPAFSRSVPWHSYGGLTITAQQRVWLWRGLHIQLEAPWTSADHGSLWIATDAALRAKDAQDRDTRRKALGDL